jgi:DNA ligase-1
MIQPMLAQKAEHPQIGVEWLAELKLDGIRFLYSTDEGRSAWTRHGTPCLSRFPELESVVVPEGTALDGELICLDEDGKPCWEYLMARFATKDERKVRVGVQTHPVEYVVFDLIRWKGQCVTSWPLLERKALLEELEEGPHLARVRFVVGQGRELFALVQEQNLEGIVQKRSGSQYEIGKRSEAWRKVIHWHHQDVVLTGILKEDGAWLVGVESGDKIRPAGVIEFPPPPDVRQAVWRIVPLAKTRKDKQAVYLRPEIQLRVKWARGGRKRDGFAFRCLSRFFWS